MMGRFKTSSDGTLSAYSSLNAVLSLLCLALCFIQTAEANLSSRFAAGRERAVWSDA